MDIYLIRHGQSTGNGAGRILGWSDHPLTGLGQAQAEAVAGRLEALGPMPVTCSDLQRARATAETIAARWGEGVQVDPRWRELHCGRFENCTWEEFNADTELQQRLEADPLHTALTGGESVGMMLDRVTAAFDELCGRAEERLAVVTHDGPIRALLAHCLRLPAERFWTISTDHCGLTRITVTGDWISLRTINEISHLAHLPIPEQLIQPSSML